MSALTRLIHSDIYDATIIYCIRFYFTFYYAIIFVVTRNQSLHKLDLRVYIMTAFH